MRRFILIILIIAFFSISLFSQQVSLKEAEQVALNVIKERFSELSINSSLYSISSSHTEYIDSQPIYYVFNLAPTGFVIISSELSYKAVLAFSNETNFNVNELNPAVKFWVDNYAQQIFNATHQEVKVINKEWQHFLVDTSLFKANKVKSLSPLLITNWGQSSFYNTLCPVDSAGPDKHVVVGCVATALGQLINYFRFPNQGIGSYTYEHQRYGVISYNWEDESSKFNYFNMPTQISDINLDIANLLFSLGVSVDMNYGPNGSGMYNHKAAYSLRTFYKFSPQARYLFRDSLAADFDWYGTLITHLDKRIPLYYAGWSDLTFNMGHAFILDGYSDSTNYHINWGWDGYQNGYFFIDNLKPSGNDFTLLHEVIVDAVPDTINYPIQVCAANQQAVECKVLTQGIIEDGSGALSNYDNDIDCEYIAEISDSSLGINFEFLKFDLDANDYISFYDGIEDNANLFLTLYGNENPPASFNSNSSKVRIRFVTDAANTKDGWLLKFSRIKPNKYCEYRTVLTNINDSIEDGSASYMYENNAYCSWTITPNAAIETIKGIKLKIKELDLLSGDFLMIKNKQGAILARYDNINYQSNSSSELLPDIELLGEKATVIFQTNTSKRAQGFKISYETLFNNNIDSYKQNKQAQLYPNPVEDKLYLEIKDNKTNSIINILGVDAKKYEQIIISENKQQIIIDVSALKSGFYILEILSDNIIERHKFLKL